MNDPHARFARCPRSGLQRAARGGPSAIVDDPTLLRIAAPGAAAVNPSGRPCGIDMKLAFVFPGQGSQAVGMMDGFAAHPVVRETFAEASEALGEDLWALVDARAAGRA